MLGAIMWKPLSPPRLLLHTTDELLDPIESFLNVPHARCITDADVVVRAEGNTRHGGNLFRLQQPGAELGGFQSRSGNLWKQVKRPLGVHARNAGK